jgi:Transglycosylase-like domain
LRLSLWLCFCTVALALIGVAHAAQATHSHASGLVRTMRISADHYRTVAWTYQRAARRHVTPTTYSYRRSSDPDYLQWTVAAWQRHEYRARVAALHALQQRLEVTLPAGPGLHASLHRRITYARTLTVQLQRIYPGRPTRSLASARPVPPKQELFTWQERAAQATLSVARHATRLSVIGPRWLTSAFSCIHRYEGAWDANSGNGYYGGLQMNIGFMQHYGADFMQRWGTADRWPAWAQIAASVRAYQSGRGFWPWPNTARACGLL